MRLGTLQTIAQVRDRTHQMHALMQAQYKASEVTERGKETAQETLASSQHSAHHVLPQVGFISLWLRTGQLHCCLAGRYAAVLWACAVMSW